MPQGGPRFDPLKSSTYYNLPCFSDECPSSLCHSDANCAYYIKYADNSTSEGVIATENLQFETPDESKIVITDVVFGCGLRNIETTNEQSDGVFGLGDSLDSIVYKLGRRFSYCIGNILDHSYSFNRLTIGEGVTVEGYSTPFKSDGGYYYVTLEGINLGEERLNIDPNVFKKTSEGGEVIIDSGAILSYLPELAFNLIKKNVLGTFDGTLLQLTDQNHPELLCFLGIASQELEGFPDMTFHLANGADLVVDSGSLFYQAGPSFFCLSIVPVLEGDIVEAYVIGLTAQQYYNVAFELNEGNIYFQRIDCELLDDSFILS